MKREAAARLQQKQSRHSEIDEQLLLKDWDFARFFQGFNERLDKMKGDVNGETSDKSKDTYSSENVQSQSDLQNGNKSSNDQKPAVQHRRNESDSRISGPLGGFRRENSDFFPASSRHSAILLESKSNGVSFSGSGRKVSDIAGSSVVGLNLLRGLGKKGASSGSKNGEPVLTDFSLIKANPEYPVRPRREKTEGDIVLLRNRQHDMDSQRSDVEQRFSRRRSSRAVDTSTSSIATLEIGEYSLRQVSCRRDSFSFLSLRVSCLATCTLLSA